MSALEAAQARVRAALAAKGVKSHVAPNGDVAVDDGRYGHVVLSKDGAYLGVSRTCTARVARIALAATTQAKEKG